MREAKGKFDFDHHFALLTIFLKRYNFLLDGIFFGSLRGSRCPKRNFPSESDFVKLGSEILYLKILCFVTDKNADSDSTQFADISTNVPL